jgi:hypothetical protein
MADVFEINFKPMRRFTRDWAKEFRKLMAADKAVDAAARRGVEIVRDLLGEEGQGIVWGHEFRTVKKESTGEFYLLPVPADWSRGPADHRSSAPFDPPASYTGALERGVMWQRGPRSGGMEATSQVQVVANEAKLHSLEFGAPNHPAIGGLAPRPFIRPAKERLRRELAGIYRRVLGRELARRAPKHRMWVRQIMAAKKR